MPRVDEYGSTSGLDPDDTALWVVDGALKNVPSAAARGYIDASWYADVDEQILNTAESLTGWFATRLTDGYEISGLLLDPTIKSTGSNSVTGIIHTNVNTDSLMGVNLASDTAVGSYVEVAFDLRISTAVDNDMRAFVSTGVDGTGTSKYAADFALQFPDDQKHWQTWYTIRVPIYGLTNIRSIGIRESIVPVENSSERAQFWMDNVRFREATGFDRAVYSAPAGSHIIIPSTYTTAKTQLPVWREAANITWEDRRS